MTKQKNSEPLSFEQAYQRLDAIVRELDEGELTLDELEKKFEEGMQMAARCSERLEQVEQKVSLLIEKAQGGMDRKSYENSEEG